MTNANVSIHPLNLDTMLNAVLEQLRVTTLSNDYLRETNDELKAKVAQLETEIQKLKEEGDDRK